MINKVFITFFDLFVLVTNFLILVRVILSWLPFGGPKFNQAINDLTEPVLGLVRRLLPKTSGLDLAPIITIIALGLLQNFLHGLISGL